MRYLAMPNFYMNILKRIDIWYKNPRNFQSLAIHVNSHSRVKYFSAETSPIIIKCSISKEAVKKVRSNWQFPTTRSTHVAMEERSLRAHSLNNTEDLLLWPAYSRRIDRRVAITRGVAAGGEDISCIPHLGRSSSLLDLTFDKAFVPVLFFFSVSYEAIHCSESA